MTTNASTAPRPRIPADELRALVTIETVERLIGEASHALESGDLDHVRALFGAIVDETTTRTATAVKTQGASDYIAGEARKRVAAARALIAEQALRDREAAERVGELVEGVHIGPGHTDHSHCTEDDCSAVGPADDECATCGGPAHGPGVVCGLIWLGY